MSGWLSKEEEVFYTINIMDHQDGDVLVTTGDICLVFPQGSFLPWKVVNGRQSQEDHDGAYQ